MIIRIIITLARADRRLPNVFLVKRRVEPGGGARPARRIRARAAAQIRGAQARGCARAGVLGRPGRLFAWCYFRPKTTAMGVTFRHSPPPDGAERLDERSERAGPIGRERAEQSRSTIGDRRPEHPEYIYRGFSAGATVYNRS